MNLAEFLLARIEEDEQHARACPMSFHVTDPSGFTPASFPWSVPRVLAECEAKRRIIEACNARLSNRGYIELNEEVLQLLALPYAGHPDYREEWRP